MQSNKKQKICIAFSSDLSLQGGAQARVRAMVTGLRKNGFDVSLVIPTPKMKLPNELHEINIHTVPIAQKRSLISRIYTTALIVHKAKKVKKHTGAILQFEHYILLGIYATLTGSSGFVLDMHDLGFDSEFSKNLPLHKQSQKVLYHFEKLVAKRAHKIIVVSNSMKDFIAKEWNIPEKKIFVIPNGYFESKLKVVHNIEGGDGVVSFIGTLHPKLDIDKFIGVGKLLKSLNGFLYIIGDGPLRNLIDQTIKQNNLMENIILTGQISDIEAYNILAKSQVTIFPLKTSRSVNTKSMSPVKIFDYGGLGKAMVLDDISEVCKIFKKNDAALVSDPENHDEFIENVRILLEDKKLREELGRNAKELVKDFTWEKQAEKLVEIYNGMV